ncbi:MAG: Holliday junction branch migration protein RuvA [Verrucomicrobiae bacterium]|nr:Holliday junction branch migration protein RuvA [Verrucomicrobiae bacterium]
MITFLKGTLVDSLPNRAILDVNGVGYEVLIPISTYDKLPAPGQAVQLLTHFHVREQEQSLYGFGTHDERDLFRLLIQRVSGIGPKLGMAVLSGMTVSQFKSAVVNGDVATISKISGVGKKTAERVVLELKDKVGVADAWEAATMAEGGGVAQALANVNDAVLALISLGFKQVEAHKAIQKCLKSGEFAEDAPADELIRAALRTLN